MFIVVCLKLVMRLCFVCCCLVSFVCFVWLFFFVLCGLRFHCALLLFSSIDVFVYVCV